MRAFVTGVAGFIGSRLAELLLDDGHEVVGVDCFTGYYSPQQKRANLEQLLAAPSFEFHDADLVTSPDLVRWLEGADVAFHQAAQAGVRGSWASGFDAYVHHNVLGTQTLLEAVVQARVPRVIYASSSSVYGNASRYPTVETDLPRPFSPYGVTKLAAEHLLDAYAHNFGVEAVALRYHTVYGPRQRPDMAIHRLIRSALEGTPFRLFAAGDFVRDFTFVDDICRANLLAAAASLPKRSVILNVAGGQSVTMRELIARIEDLAGSPVSLVEVAAQAGDVTQTGGDSSAAAAVLGWRAETALHAGLSQQIAWHRSRSCQEA